MRLDDNKSELFHYLSQQCVTIECADNKQVVSTLSETVLTSLQTQDISAISPCNHEKADTRLVLHAQDACNHGYHKLIIRTVDSDVLVIAVALCHYIKPQELWIAFGTGQNLRYQSVHSISQSLGLLRSKSLLAFHSITGCDQTSAFANRGKKTAWAVLEICEAVTPAFHTLSYVPTQQIVEDIMPQIERFVVLLYDKTSECSTVNEARKDLFTRKGRSIESIPPTSAALLQHVKRSAYQAGHQWGQSLLPSPSRPCPSDWGWIKGPSQTWEPYWTHLPPASKICRELLKCGCNPDRGCRGQCKCVWANMACTALCKCGGGCDRN